MAITNQNSTQLAAALAEPSEYMDPSEHSGKKRASYFSFTQSGAGDADSTIVLAKLPAGRLRIVLDETRIANSALGSGRTLNIGLQAYTSKDGSAVAADDDALKAGVAAASAATAAISAAAGADPTVFVNSRDGVTIEATVKGGTIPDAATLFGVITYIKE